MDKKKQRTDKLQRQQEIVNAARTENRALTADENAEFQRLQSEIEVLNIEIEAERSATAPATEDSAASQRAVEKERTRISAITDLCRSFDIAPDEYIKNGASLENVRAAVLEKLKTTHAPLHAGSIQVTGSGEDDFRRDAVDGMLLRGGVQLSTPNPGAEKFSHMTMRDLAVECLEREGRADARRLSPSDLFHEVSTRQYFNPTAAFPAMLDNAINKAYVEGHKQVAVTFDQWTKKGTLTDFKTHDNNYLAGPIGDFEEVPEGAELKSDRPTDAKLPTRKLKTYGKQFTLTRQAFINDDIALITRIPARHAAAARRTINRQCYDILLSNKTIYDGKALFCADHKNVLTTGTGFTQAALQAMIMAMMTQTDQFNQSIVIRPASLLLPVGMEFQVATLLNSPTIQTPDNTQAVNPLYAYRDQLKIITDPEVNAKCGGFGNVMPWFLLANPDDTAFIEVDYLDGKEIPTIRRMETAGQLGFVWDIWLDWGINVMDYRGAIKNPGARIENPLG